MIRITGDEAKDRILSPYFEQYHVLLRKMGTPDFMELVDNWLDKVLKVIDKLDKNNM